MRGDGDLWDYCVDDPVNRVDPWGLEANSCSAGVAISGFGLEGGVSGYYAFDNDGGRAVGISANGGASSDWGPSFSASCQGTDASSAKQLEGKSEYVTSRVGPVTGQKVQGDGYTGTGTGVSAGLSTIPVPGAVGTGVEYSQHLVEWKGKPGYEVGDID